MTNIIKYIAFLIGYFHSPISLLASENNDFPSHFLISKGSWICIINAILLGDTSILSQTTISVRTLYRYIDISIFLKLTNKELLIKSKKRVAIKKFECKKKSM